MLRFAAMNPYCISKSQHRRSLPKVQFGAVFAERIAEAAIYVSNKNGVLAVFKGPNLG